MGFKLNLNVGSYLLNAMKELPDSVQGSFRQEMQTVVKPAIDGLVAKYLAPYPPERKETPPFEFATLKSQRAYFASNGFGKGIPYKRSGTLGRGWNVAVSYKFQDSLIRISNVQPYSKFVYGPRQVPGHRTTGWGADFDKKAGLVQDGAEQEIVNAWGRAIAKAIQDF